MDCDYLFIFITDLFGIRFYLIGKEIIGEPTTCKARQRTCSLEGLTAVRAETKTAGPCALIKSINQAIEIHPVFLGGKEIILFCHAISRKH